MKRKMKPKRCWHCERTVFSTKGNVGLCLGCIAEAHKVLEHK